MTRVDLEDDWTPLDDLVALHTAEDAGELHRRLLLLGSGGGNRADAFEPWCLFHMFHADDPEDAVVTAMLLLTDRRWCNATGRLVRRIEESRLLPDEELDLLAQAFLAAAPHVYWKAPGDWFDGPTIVVDEDAPDVAVIEDDEPGSPDGPVVFEREIRPPLRRWAAARAVRSEPSCWGALDLAENWPHRKLREAATVLRQRPELAPAPTSVPTPVQGSSAPSAAQPSLF